MTKRVLNALFTAIAITFILPTTLILVSWSAIPGDKLYSLKSGLEDVVLAVFSGTPLVPKVSLAFTERRFDEAILLLDKKGSTVGYDLLVAEAQQTQNYIVEKEDGEGVVQFTQNIEKYQQEIVKKKAEVKAEIQLKTISQVSAPSSNVMIPTPTTVVVPTSKPTTVKIPETSTSDTVGQVVVVTRPEVVVIKEEKPEELLQKLEATEIKLEKIKQDTKDKARRRNFYKKVRDDDKLFEKEKDKDREKDD